MECAARSAAAHKMGFNNYCYYNLKSSSETYLLGSTPDKS